MAKSEILLEAAWRRIDDDIGLDLVRVRCPPGRNELSGTIIAV